MFSDSRKARHNSFAHHRAALLFSGRDASVGPGRFEHVTPDHPARGTLVDLIDFPTGDRLPVMDWPRELQPQAGL